MVLSWRGPRFTTDFVFGNDIDAVGERSPVPSVAVRLLQPWDRLVVVTGKVDLDWHREDALLAMAMARRLRHTRPMPLTVVTPNPEMFEDRVGDPEAVEFVVERDERRALVEGISGTDLIVVTAHVLHDLPAVRSWRATKRLENANLAIVGGPHRLSISKGMTRQASTTGVTLPA